MLPEIYVDQELRTLFTHGHLFTMFNAPDKRPNIKIPVGHFVTRAICYYQTEKLLKDNSKTVADYADWGVPSQVSSALLTISQRLFSNEKFSVTDFLLKTIAESTGMSVDQTIILPDGSDTTITKAKPLYNSNGGLLQEWITRYGILGAAKSAYADYNLHGLV
jgi:hypothetical protein